MHGLRCLYHLLTAALIGVVGCFSFNEIANISLADAYLDDECSQSDRVRIVLFGIHLQFVLCSVSYFSKNNYHKNIIKWKNLTSLRVLETFLPPISFSCRSVSLARLIFR